MREKNETQGTAAQVPFQRIREAARTTGLSQYFLRNGCIAGTVPHVRSGQTYFVNIPVLLEQLQAKSKNAGAGRSDKG